MIRDNNKKTINAEKFLISSNLRHYPSLKHIEKDQIMAPGNKIFRYDHKNYLEFKFENAQGISGILFNNITQNKNKAASTKIVEIQIDDKIITQREGLYLSKHNFNMEEKFYQKIFFPINQSI